MSGEKKKVRRNCIKIHVLSPFLFGVVPPGHEDKVCDGLDHSDILSERTFLTKDQKSLQLGLFSKLQNRRHLFSSYVL